MPQVGRPEGRPSVQGRPRLAQTHPTEPPLAERAGLCMSPGACAYPSLARRFTKGRSLAAGTPPRARLPLVLTRAAQYTSRGSPSG
jgi:hypothetical protein